MTAKKFETIVREHEDNERPKIEQSRVRLASALQQHPELTEAAHLAEEAREEFESQWRRGNPEPTAADYSLALAEETRAKALAKAAEKEIDKARGGIKSTDARVAELAALVVQKAFPSIVVVSSFTTPAERPRLAECPAALVVPLETVENPDGTLSGRAEVFFYRDASLHQRLEAKRIEGAAKDLPNAGVSIHATSLGNDPVRTAAFGAGIERDRLVLEVSHGTMGAVPVIARVDESGVSRALAEYLANAVKSPTLISAHAEALNRSTSYWTSDRLAALPHEVHVVSDDVDDDGNRTLVLDSSVIVRILPNSGLGAIEGWATATEAFVERLRDGWMIAGVGVSTSAERVTEGSELLLSDTEARALAMHMRPTTMQRVDSAQLHGPRGDMGRCQVVVRGTFISRIAA